MAKKKTYYVQANIDALVQMSIRAASLEEALEKAKGLTAQDFITFDEEEITSSFEICGIYS